MLRVLKLYYKVASSQLPAPQLRCVLKLHYKVASSQLPAPQIAPRTKVVLQSRHSYSAYYSCTTKSPVLSFQLHGLLRVLKLYYKVASSQLPAPQLLRLLQLYYQVASSHLPAPQLVCVLKLYYKVTSSHLPPRQILRVLKMYYKVASSHLTADHSRPEPTTQPPDSLTERDLLQFPIRQRRRRPQPTKADNATTRTSNGARSIAIPNTTAPPATTADQSRPDPLPERDLLRFPIRQRRRRPQPTRADQSRQRNHQTL